eukprot:s637_g20.t1
MRGLVPGGRAVGATSMAAEGTQQIIGTGGLRAVLRQAAEVHAVPAAGGEGGGKAGHGRTVQVASNFPINTVGKNEMENGIEAAGPLGLG